MKNEKIKGLVNKRMGKNPKDVSYTRLRISIDPTSRAAWKQWYQDFTGWGVRVRRDILVIEEHLKSQGKLTKDDFYGDPGDPPPDPIE